MRKLAFIPVLCATLLVSCSSDDDGGGEIEVPVVESATLDIESGGSTQPNQVYIDLSTEDMTVVRRDSWELGFISGSDNKVVLNPSILVSAAKLEGFHDLDGLDLDADLTNSLELQTLNFTTFQMEEVTVNTIEELLEGLPMDYSMYGNLETGIRFTDSQDGNLSTTAIGSPATSEEEAPVILVSLGSSIPTADAEAGAINTTGEHRGFFKIKVFMNGDDYVLQYAPLEATSHTQVTLPKDADNNTLLFSLEQGGIANVQPNTEDWDLNYTSIYSYYGNFNGLTAGLTYSDFVLHNTHNGVGVYSVSTEEDGYSYDEFTAADVVASNFITDDRSAIGSSWRSTSDGPLPDLFYVIKDTDGKIYKLRFTAWVNNSGERGHPQITYDLLQE